VCVNRVRGDGTVLISTLSEKWRLERDRARTYRTNPHMLVKFGPQDIRNYGDRYASAGNLSGTE
jgi:hypothetical protein